MQPILVYLLNDIVLFLGGIYHEGCDCPESDSEKWEDAMQCPNNYTQIERDLEKFNKIDLKRLAKEGVERFGVHNALCHYSIIDNKVNN
jgi:hypothetical protein